MNASELKYNVERTGSYFFSRDSMKFFGDRMSNYGVRTAMVDTWDGEQVECWELYRRRPVLHGLSDSAYFDKRTYQRVHPAK